MAPMKETVVKLSIINYRSAAASNACCVLIECLLICLVNMIVSLCVFVLPYLDILFMFMGQKYSLQSVGLVLRSKCEENIL